jgi:hypothetical protein
MDNIILEFALNKIWISVDKDTGYIRNQASDSSLQTTMKEALKMAEKPKHIC